MSKPPNPDSQRPSPGQAWRNFTQPMPLDRKMRLVYRNILIRFRHRQDCCGHPGQPGC
jgi:hypothetical protein